MWTSRCVFLLALAAVLLHSASPVDSFDPIIGLPCCLSVSSRRIRDISRCFEQKPREGCNRHAFLMETTTHKQQCVNPNAPWLKKKIQKGELSCPDLIS